MHTIACNLQAMLPICTRACIGPGPQHLLFVRTSVLGMNTRIPPVLLGTCYKQFLVVSQAEADLPRYPLYPVASHAVLRCAVLLQDGFVVTTKGNMKFSEVDLSEGEWTEYDEKINESVGIFGLESKWELHKGK